MHKVIGLILLSLSLSNFFSVVAYASDYQHAQRYDVTMRGIPVGYMVAGVKKTGERVMMEANIKATGAAHGLTKFKLFSKATFIDKGNQILPKTFESSSRLRKRWREVTLSFDDKGQITHEAVNPPDKRWKRPAVKEALKNTVFDPLVAAYGIRHYIDQYRKKGGDRRIAIPLYEARRRSNLFVTINGETLVNLDGEKHPAIHITLQRQPVAGYTKKELAQYEKFKPTIEIYLSDDAYLLPLTASGTAPHFIKFKAKRGKWCDTVKDCTP